MDFRLGIFKIFHNTPSKNLFLNQIKYLSSLLAKKLTLSLGSLNWRRLFSPLWFFLEVRKDRKFSKSSEGAGRRTCEFSFKMSQLFTNLKGLIPLQFLQKYSSQGKYL